MAKQKTENRCVQESWEADYLFTNIRTGQERTDLLAVTKEYNLRRHCETKHYEKHKDPKKAEALEGRGDEKKSGFPADYFHESKIKK